MDCDLSPEGKQGSADASAIRSRQIYLTVVVVALAAWIALEFLTPIAWAAILAIAEWPLYLRVVARVPPHRGLVAVGFAIATGLLLILPLSVAAVVLTQESQAALEWLQHAQRFGITMPIWLPGLPLVGVRVAGWWQSHVGTPQAANAVLSSMSATSILGWTRSIGAEAARQSAVFLMTLLALVTLLARGELIATQARIVARRMFGEFGTGFLEQLVGAVRATVIGTLLVSIGEGTLIGIGYAVAGVPQPLLFATFTIVLALVPFGAWLAFGLASAILIASGSLIAGGLLFGFGVIVMTVGDNVIQPSVIGSAIKLPFLLALVGAFGGLAEMGLVGLFVGPVVMASLLLVYRLWVVPRGPCEQPEP